MQISFTAALQLSEHQINRPNAIEQSLSSLLNPRVHEGMHATNVRALRTLCKARVAPEIARSADVRALTKSPRNGCPSIWGNLFHRHVLHQRCRHILDTAVPVQDVHRKVDT